MFSDVLRLVVSRVGEKCAGKDEGPCSSSVIVQILAGASDVEPPVRTIPTGYCEPGSKE